MSTRTTLATMFLCTTTLALNTASASGAPGALVPVAAMCQLQTHHITSVTPYLVEEQLGKMTFTHLRGASIGVQAEPGLTKEWLQLSLTRSLTAMAGTPMKDCPLDAGNVTIVVDSTGSGFVVKLTTRDETQAGEVLRRSRLLLKPSR